MSPIFPRQILSPQCLLCERCALDWKKKTKKQKCEYLAIICEDTDILNII